MFIVVPLDIVTTKEDLTIPIFVHKKQLLFIFLMISAYVCVFGIGVRFPRIDVRKSETVLN